MTDWGEGHNEKRELLKMKTKVLAAHFQIFMSMFSKSISDTLGMKLNFFLIASFLMPKRLNQFESIDPLTPRYQILSTLRRQMKNYVPI